MRRIGWMLGLLALAATARADVVVEPLDLDGCAGLRLRADLGEASEEAPPRTVLGGWLVIQGDAPEGALYRIDAWPAEEALAGEWRRGRYPHHLSGSGAVRIDLSDCVGESAGRWVLDAVLTDRSSGHVPSLLSLTVDKSGAGPALEIFRSPAAAVDGEEKPREPFRFAARERPPTGRSLAVMPNPAVGGARFSGTTADKSTGPVRLAVHDLRGRKVRTLDGTTEGGVFSMAWDGLDDGGRPVSAGVYFVRRCGAAAVGSSVRFVLLR